MNTARFISSNEVHEIVGDLFSIDKNIIRQLKTEEELKKIRENWIRWMESNEMKITVIFDENNNPLGMYTARLVPKISGWLVGATKIKKPNSNFYITAKIMVPGLELLIQEMENMEYYKFWMIAPENHHNIRNSIMKKYSPSLNRYEWYDEEIIPAGKKSKVPLFELHNNVVNWTDRVVRMFVLKQEYRNNLLKQNYHKL